MLNVIDASRKEIWNGTVKSFDNWDIYYLQEYALSFQIHGDGTPFLVEYRDDNARFCYVVMMSDIADAPQFKGVLEHGRYFDLETPYGYGGPLSDGPVPETSQDRFMAAFSEYAESKGIVSQFVRFHPLLMNHETAPRMFETRYLHDTVYIDTSSPEIIMGNMGSKNRNMVRKAIKNGVTVERRRIMEDLIFSYSDRFPVKTARFANVAFSNGSLPAGFLARIRKLQPLSAPSDVKRYFVLGGGV